MATPTTTTPRESEPWSVPRVLIVDDDVAVRRLVCRSLAREAIAVREAADIPGALAEIAADPPDLLLLDVMLRGVSGFDALPRFRELGIPVILVTGRDEVTDRVLGLELGADDYVVKPFDPRELASRVRAVLRRVHAPGPRGVHASRIVHGDLEIDLGSRSVTVAGKPVELTSRELDLLTYLARRPRQVCTRDELIAEVWHSAPEWQGSGTITEHMRRLRAKLEPDPRRPRWLQTVRGVGYRFDP